MESAYKPYTEIREPTEKEQHELMHYYEEEVGYDATSAYDVAFRSAIVIIEGYQTDSPGYTGKLMVVIGGAPYIYEVFKWDSNSHIRHVRKDGQL